MSVVFGLVTSDPNLLKCELHRLGSVIALDGESANAVGVGTYGDGDVLLRRFPAGEGPSRLDALTPRHESGSLLYHAARLPVGTSLEENTQPFRARHWL